MIYTDMQVDVLRALGAEIVRTPSLAGYDAPGRILFLSFCKNFP